MSIVGQPPGTAGKVPVWRTAVESYRFVFANLDRFLALGWLPILVIFGVNLAFGFLDRLHIRDLVWLLSCVPWAVFAVRWHRLVLLKDRAGAFKELFAPRNLRFLTYALFLSLTAGVIAMFVMVSAVFFVSLTLGTEADLPGTSQAAAGLNPWLVFNWAVTILLYLPVLRFTLLLPGAAVDRPLSLGQAWREMGGNSWRYISVVILMVIPYLPVYFFLSEFWSYLLAPYMSPNEAEVSVGVLAVISLVNAVIGVLMIAIGATALSNVYRHIVGGERGEGGAVAAPA